MSKITYRKHSWLNIQIMKEKFGIQSKATGYEARWLHCTDGGMPLIYDTAEERDAKLKELRTEQRKATKGDA